MMLFLVIFTFTFIQLSSMNTEWTYQLCLVHIHSFFHETDEIIDRTLKICVL